MQHGHVSPVVPMAHLIDALAVAVFVQDVPARGSAATAAAVAIITHAV
jgi:hypothetical protein